MEVVLCAALTTLWWVSSVSVLLPLVMLLKFSPAFRNKWFSWLFSCCVRPVFEPRLLPLREQCFDLLDEHMAQNEPELPLRILEIGIGTGANLQFYPKDTRLIAVDMNPSFEAYFHQNRKKYPQVTLERTVLAMAEDMKEVENESVDVVVSTYVLCSVEDIVAVLQEIKRVLVPGGRFVFLEHVAFPTSQWSFTIQWLVAPLWKLYFAGCCPDRDIAKEVESAGFSQVFVNKTEATSLMLFVRPQITGIATK